MLTELCQELKNWFPVEIHSGTYTISNGNIDAYWLKPGQYFRIIGSIFSDGVYKYPAAELPDETFTGAVWGLAIPKEIIQLAEDIEAWRAKYEAPDSDAMSPFTSESFGGYSYSKAAGGTAAGSSTQVTWQSVFKKRLNMWRKIL